MALSGIYPLLQGARFEQADSSPLFATHTCCKDNQGGEWIYAQADEAIAAHDLCKISTAATAQAEPVAAGDIDALVPKLGIPQVALADGEYGWFWRGPGGGVGFGIKVNAALNCAQDVLLFATATDGVVGDAVVTDDCIAGLTICATITTAAAAECYATIPLAANLDEGVA